LEADGETALPVVDKLALVEGLLLGMISGDIGKEIGRVRAPSTEGFKD